MRKVSLLLFLVLFTCGWLHAQDWNNYRPIKSQGQIPKKFVTTSTEKYLKEVESNIGANDRGNVKKDKKQFFLESNFVIDELLLSGKVLFNDPVSNYISSVLDELLKNDRELRTKIEVYLVRSPSVNAFTTNNGIIIVTMGLIAQLEDEAQLAYILSHEIIHFKEKHGVKQYIETRNIARGRGVYRNTSLEDKLLARSNYSKKDEKEADMDGLRIFLNSNYSIGSVDGVFDVLQYSHLPFDEVKYDRAFLETQNMKFPDKFFLEEINDIKANDEDDSLGTHPGVKIRREIITDELRGKSNTDKKEYIVSKEEFLKMQKICRYEMSNMYLQNRRYEEAFYNSYLLMKEYPDSKYLKKSIAKSLYGLSKYATYSRFDEVHDDYDEIQGQSQQVYHMFEILDREELSILATEYIWNLRLQYPDDHEIAALSNDIMAEMVHHHIHDKDYFYTHSLKQMDSARIADSIANAKQPEKPKEEKKKLSKYEKIKKEKEEEKSSKEGTEEAFTKFAFVDLLKNEKFDSALTAQIKDYPRYKEREDYKKTYKYKLEKRKKDAKERKNGANLGLKKVVFVNPFYYKVDESKKKPLKLVASEAAQKEFNNKIQRMADMVDLNYELIDKKDLKEGSVDLFNDIAVLNAYMEETNKHDDMKYVNYLSEDFVALKDKYKTEYFVWTGVINLKEKKEFEFTTCCLAVLVYPVLPFYIYSMAKPDYTTYLYSMVVNVETGEKVNVTLNNYKYNDRSDLLNQTLYNLFSGYKKKKKRS